MGLSKSLIGITLAVSVLFVKAPDAAAQKPVISSLSPDNGIAGDRVRIFGSNFENILGITFNGVLAPSFAVTAQNQLEVTVPQGAASGPISIQNASGIGISPVDFRVFNPGPRPIGVAPQTAVAGEIITITGQLFSPQTQVIFSGDVTATQVSIRTEGELDVVVPAGAGTGPITLRDSRGANISDFTFTVVVQNNISFQFVNPTAVPFAVGETGSLQWSVKSAASAGARDVEITFLLPESGIIFTGVQTGTGQYSQAGRFVQVTGGFINGTGEWTGALQFIPTAATGALAFEGSASSVERDPDLTNNSMVRAYQAVVGQGLIEIQRTSGSGIRLDWPAYPDDWKLDSCPDIGSSNPTWTPVSITPQVENNRKFIQVDTSAGTGTTLYYRIRR